MSKATVSMIDPAGIGERGDICPAGEHNHAVELGTPQREQLGQFCAPPGENEVPRLYCRDWHGDGDIAGRGLRTPT